VNITERQNQCTSED